MNKEKGIYVVWRSEHLWKKRVLVRAEYWQGLIMESR